MENAFAIETRRATMSADGGRVNSLKKAGVLCPPPYCCTHSEQGARLLWHEQNQSGSDRNRLNKQHAVLSQYVALPLQQGPHHAHSSSALFLDTHSTPTTTPTQPHTPPSAALHALHSCSSSSMSPHSRISWSESTSALRVAVLGSDGCVHILRLTPSRVHWQTPSLRSELLGAASSIAIRPCNSNPDDSLSFGDPSSHFVSDSLEDTIAAGFLHGELALWVRRELLVFEAAPKQHQHSPVTSLCWSPDALILASLSCHASSQVILWRASYAGSPIQGEPLRAISNTLWAFRFSPWSIYDQFLKPTTQAAESSRAERTTSWGQLCWGRMPGARVPGGLFGCADGRGRLWDSFKWDSVSMSGVGGVRCAAWSPTANILMLARGCELVAVFHGVAESAGGAGSKKYGDGARVVHTEWLGEDKVRVEGELGASVVVGGEIASIAWDSTGERVAVAFAEQGISSSTGGASRVAVFSVRERPSLQMVPLGVVQGGGGPSETAVAIAFGPQLPTGAILSVLWSTMHLSIVPMAFKSS